MWFSSQAAPAGASLGLRSPRANLPSRSGRLPTPRAEIMDNGGRRSGFLPRSAVFDVRSEQLVRVGFRRHVDRDGAG
jgi:hypothetical protein